MTDDDINLLANIKNTMQNWKVNDVENLIDAVHNAAVVIGRNRQKADDDSTYEDGLKTGEVIGIEKQKTIDLSQHAEQMAREYQRGKFETQLQMTSTQYHRGVDDGKKLERERITKNVEAVLSKYSQAYTEMIEIRNALRGD